MIKSGTEGVGRPTSVSASQYSRCESVRRESLEYMGIPKGDGGFGPVNAERVRLEVREVHAVSISLGFGVRKGLAFRSFGILLLVRIQEWLIGN